MNDQTTRAFAGIGANLGDAADTLRRAVANLGGGPGIRVVAASSVYRNPPVGPQDQPDFLNAVLELAVTLEPRDLLDRFLAVEQSFGRVRKVRWGPRTLDLDILLYGDRRVDEPGLTIPHPHMLERPFVLVPLADLFPQGRHPAASRSYGDLAGAVDRSTLTRVDVHLLGPDTSEV